MYFHGMVKSILSCLLLLAAIAGHAQTYPSFEKKALIRNSDTLLYRVQYPLQYNAGKKYPLVLVLHGSGERGRDNEAQLKWGGSLFADSATRMKYPAIVVFPQCPLTDGWARVRGRTDVDSSKRFTFLSDQPIGTPLGMALELIDSLVATGRIDSKKIYIGGLSMGGMGTYEALWRKPTLFAAAFPICGAGDTAKVGSYATKFPVWVFQGDKDPAVAVTYARSMVAALKAAGATVTYNEYPGVGHDSWKNAFAEPMLLEWLFKQKR